MGLQRILSLLEAEDADVRIHAVKVVANLAAEGYLYCLLVLKNHIYASPSRETVLHINKGLGY